MSKEKDLNYWKANAEEDYKQVPISVLRYISELEEKVNKNSVLGDVSNYDFFCKETLLINGKGKCKTQCKDCLKSENTEYTDTSGHNGSCC